MPDASPVKWHLAHTTWFFETFVLCTQRTGYVPLHAQYGYLYNSYYEALGERVVRSERGLMTRPTLAEVREYRAHVDRALVDWISGASAAELAAAAPLIETGLHHEQQHQELMLTDVKHLLSLNPQRPAYRSDVRRARTPREACGPAPWMPFPGGVVRIGEPGSRGFHFDNEGPAHERLLRPFRIAARLTTCGEYLAFMEDGGYSNASLWLSDGWSTLHLRGWRAPLYWEQHDGAWQQLTLGGMRAIDPDEPVTHVSFYEADAFARWAGARLAGEDEWEIAARSCPVEGNFVESDLLHPAPTAPSESLRQMFGDTWEWTQSAYAPYPGYRAPAGALGEYNGKFMCNQVVLRGGSCVTPRSHIRATYRNFFYPDARWQFSGIRLAQDV
jgi:ergothioneine biosynthesis protein EgtB